jgi:hypothetical protein
VSVEKPREFIDLHSYVPLSPGRKELMASVERLVLPTMPPVMLTRLLTETEKKVRGTCKLMCMHTGLRLVYDVSRTAPCVMLSSRHTNPISSDFFLCYVLYCTIPYGLIGRENQI